MSKRTVAVVLTLFCFLTTLTACSKDKNKDASSDNSPSSSEYKPTTTYVSSDTKVMEPEKDYLTYATDPCPLMKNIYHRGMSALAPECTEMAYRYAAKAGYKYAENDLWFSSDGYPVMVHMKDLSSTSNGEGYVTDKTLEYLKTLDFGNQKVFGDLYKGTKLLTFEEWIALCKEIDLNPYIDCKMFKDVSYTGKSGIETCLDILNKYGMAERATWIVGISGAKSVRRTYPAARIAVIADKSVSDEAFEYMKSIVDPNDNDKLVLNMAANNITQEIVDKCKAAGIGVEAWLADSTAYKFPGKAATLYKMGITGFTNDGLNIGKALKEAGYSW